MAYLIIIGGIFLGSIVFLFTYIASKKFEKYYIAPVITFLFFIAISLYGFIIVGGFDGLGYVLIAFGFLIAGVAGTLLLPGLSRRSKSKECGKSDKLMLIVLPLIFFTVIGSAFYLDRNYWVIDEGEKTYMGDSYYEISTISEGNKQVALTLGEAYAGKTIEVENINHRGSTDITINIVDSRSDDKTPYIWIGLYDINEPLTIRTTDGTIIE